MQQVRDVNGTQLAIVRPASGGFPRHSHDEYVISTNLCGREAVRLDRASFDVDLDEVTVYNPGQVQSCTTRTPDGTAFACVSWYVPSAVLTALTGGAPVDFERPVVRSAPLRAELLRAARDLPGGDPALIEERLTLILLRLLDLAADTGGAGWSHPDTGGAGWSHPGTRGAGRRSPGDARIAAVLDRLRGDLSSPPSLAGLAEDAGMSREHLIRSFTRATGCPPYAWHLQARLAEGRRRLRRGEPVADVAHALGFADQAHFHRHFTAAYAVTPGRYRRVNI
ncbi:AraC family transcriptional regulator [Nonomuraea turkmeniaca]|uniref:AraC family transcriptional regulator n=1 Tax=Nonomuraea turkmeniaca TaxID=103838 RepID=A0A5S4FCQ7_9ACTN|nr:AraC family transcriptional regulator [Nonomuraea turkmeniaca]TMR16102.1 AraC family transcriptional regulator [Nonomuraea turkmeniaca]